jgi:hypothetical protein
MIDDARVRALLLVGLGDVIEVKYGMARAIQPGTGEIERRSLPVHEETVTAPWRISMKTESVVINKGLVFDGRLFATPNDRGRYIGTVTKNRPQWLKDNPDTWWSVRDITNSSTGATCRKRK